MARTVRDSKLENRTRRKELSARKEPYWRLIAEGEHLGYYKGRRGGTWVARFRPGKGAYRKTKLGRADDVSDSDGATVLSFSEVQAKARQWFEECRRESEGVATTRGPYTVRDAIDDYLNEYENRGGKDKQSTRKVAEARILPELGDLQVSALRPERLRTWLADLAKAPARLRTKAGGEQNHREASGDPEQVRRRRATANRILTILKAALNHALDGNKVASDVGWKAVKPFKKVDKARIRYLSLDEVTRLVNACDPRFRPMVQAALFTGMRYGELAALQVGDYNPDAGTVYVHQSKSGKARHVVLTEEGQGFFAEAAIGRPRNALLIPKPDGKLWARSEQRRPMLKACKHAGIEPAIGFHILRHTYGSHLAMNGAPLQVIAQNLGHVDTRMVEKHYAHLAPSYVADAIRAAAPRLGIAEVTEVKRFASARLSSS